MAGTVLGSVDHVLSIAASGSIQEQFTNLFRFLNGPLRSGSYVDLVALQYGSNPAGSPAAGSNYHNERNPFGDNAFACFRWRSGSVGADGPSRRRARDFYMLCQWSWGTFGASPGNPGKIYAGSPGLGLAIAWRDDGVSAWNGTSNADGTDTKGSVVWTSGSSVVHVLPRSNNAGGSHNLLKENTVGFPQSTTNPTRYHFLADRDGLLIMGDNSDNASYDYMLYVGAYEPISSSQFVTSSGGNMQMPMVMIGANGAFPFGISTTYGDLAGNATTQGGIVGPRTGSAEVRTVRMDRYSNNLLSNTSLQPNQQFDPNAYDEFKIPVMLFEAPQFGHVGYLDMITETYNVPVHSTNADFTKATFGAGGNVINLVAPWSGSAPGSTSTRQGRQF